jgi:hypothetical protein
MGFTLEASPMTRVPIAPIPIAEPAIIRFTIQEAIPCNLHHQWFDLLVAPSFQCASLKKTCSVGATATRTASTTRTWRRRWRSRTRRRTNGGKHRQKSHRIFVALRARCRIAGFSHRTAHFKGGFTSLATEVVQRHVQECRRLLDLCHGLKRPNDRTPRRLNDS